MTPTPLLVQVKSTLQSTRDPGGEARGARPDKDNDKEEGQRGQRTAVAAEDLLVDDGRDREAIEAVRERLPQLDVVPPLACSAHTHKTL